MAFCPMMKNGLAVLFRTSVTIMQSFILSCKANETFGDDFSH
jgi:hypothetical protein